MRAIVQTRYGPPRDVLEVRDVDVPTASAGEVLVRVRAASVHADVWHVVTGVPDVGADGTRALRSSPARGVPPLDKADVMRQLGALVDEGKITPVIDRVFSLEGVVEAMQRLQEGRAVGRIVVAP